ncbi:hypothetical protein [Candidatus Berkiella aquae]|nr:hypothetical protein [Candidatus Berkiella aquae]MCS5710676.1 hypothetical protein [Candidatus Berkiella aquae]
MPQLHFDFSEQGKEAEEILLNVGKEKISDKLRRSDENVSIQPNKINQTVKSISRAVMRHPDEKVLEMLCDLHQEMKSTFVNEPDEGIEWLLGGSRDMARGGFKNAQTFKAFLNKDPRKMSPSRLITGLETVATAIGYRMIHANWSLPPTNPNDPMQNATPAQKQMNELIQKIRFTNGDVIMPPIGEAYVNRGFDDVARSPISLDDDIDIEAEDVSEASDLDGIDEEVVLPAQKLPARVFQKHNDHALSWPAAALKSNIDVRAHTSGTAPLALSAIEGVLGYNRSGKLLTKEEELRKLSGALLVASFLRGDFHTPAETQAGVEHYISEKKKRKNPSLKTQLLQPKAAFTLALNSMSEASKNSKVSKKDKLALQSAIQMLSDEIISGTPEYETQLEKQMSKLRL